MNGLYLIAGSGDRTASLWRVSAISPGSMFPAVGFNEKRVTATPDVVYRQHAAAVYGAAVACDNAHAISASYDGRVHVWRISDGMPVTQINISGSVRNGCLWCMTEQYKDCVHVAAHNDMPARARPREQRRRRVARAVTSARADRARRAADRRAAQRNPDVPRHSSHRARACARAARVRDTAVKAGRCAQGARRPRDVDCGA